MQYTYDTPLCRAWLVNGLHIMCTIKYIVKHNTLQVSRIYVVFLTNELCRVHKQREGVARTVGISQLTL